MFCFGFDRRVWSLDYFLTFSPWVLYLLKLNRVLDLSPGRGESVVLPVIVVDASDIGLSMLVSTDFSGAVSSSFSLSFVGSLLLDFADLKEPSLLRAAA